jgi:hypothetical protein
MHNEEYNSAYRGDGYSHHPSEYKGFSNENGMIPSIHSHIYNFMFIKLGGEIYQPSNRCGCEAVPTSHIYTEREREREKEKCFILCGKSVHDYQHVHASLP